MLQRDLPFYWLTSFLFSSYPELAWGMGESLKAWHGAHSRAVNSSEHVIVLQVKSNTSHNSSIPWVFIMRKWKSLSHVRLFVTLGQNTGVGSLSLLQGIFPTQGLNPSLPHWGWILYQLRHKGSLSLLQQICPTQESNQGLLHCRQILYQLSCQGIPFIRSHYQRRHFAKQIYGLDYFI